LKTDVETPLTSGSTYELARDGAYDILCDMEGAEFVKFLYDNTKFHDGWQVPYVFSGVPDGEPTCDRDQVKYLSGSCSGSCVCDGTKTVTVQAQQTSNVVCKKATYYFKCASVPPTPTPPTPTPPAPTPSKCDLKTLTGLKTCTTKSWFSWCYSSTSYVVYESKYASCGKCYPICMDKYKIRYYAYNYPGKYTCSCTSK
jgi:hypothetical protein